MSKWLYECACSFGIAAAMVSGALGGIALLIYLFETFPAYELPIILGFIVTVAAVFIKATRYG